ncbi:MAG: FHA domain-containing protein [Acidobacteria bacterium]|nr:FHA domain-containing protein [Acidobacteriota bacterium]
MNQGPKSRFTIGRERSCDIPIADESVSRLHAELTILDGGKLFLTDCHSSNGTSVLRDGTARRISQDFVLPSDRVQFGDVILDMSDLVESVRGRVKQAAPAAPVARRDAPGGERVERCGCGAIKPQGKPCPACGA